MTTHAQTHAHTPLQKLLNFEADQFEIVKAIDAIRLPIDAIPCLRHFLSLSSSLSPVIDLAPSVP